MARLATHATLDTLLTTVGELEARVLELKRTANALATSEGLPLPFPAVSAPVAEPRVPVDLAEESGADSQD